MFRYFFTVFSIFLSASAMAEIPWELVESICAPATKYQYNGIHSGMTVAEIEALSENKPYYAPDNDNGSLQLNDGGSIYWDTDDRYTANIKNQRQYNIGYNLGFHPSNLNWLEDNSLNVYQDILSSYGEPKENRGPRHNKNTWKIVYGPKEKMVMAPDGLWVKFLNACKAEAGSSSGILTTHAGHLMGLDYNFFKAYQATVGICPSAIEKEYVEYLEDYFQPTVTFQALNDSFSMSANCPIVVSWSYLQNLKKPEAAPTEQRTEMNADGADTESQLTDIELEKRESIYKICKSDPHMSAFQDCKCVASRFMEERQKQGPDRSDNNILVPLRNECKSSTNAAEYTYRDCMNNPMTSSFSTAPKATFCKCVTRSWVTQFENFQGEITSNMRNNFTSGAILECGRELQ